MAVEMKKGKKEAAAIVDAMVDAATDLAVAQKGKNSGESMKVLAGLKKNYGDQVATLGDGYAPVDRVPSGIFPLDLATGGGFPQYRISMIFGPESSGKTALILKLLGMAQRVLKRRAVLIDAEHVYDTTWSERMGVNTKDLIVIQPDNAEQSVDASEGMMNADDVGIVVLDSLASIQPQKWIEAEVGKANVGGNTQIVSSLYTKVGAAITKQQKRDNPILFVVVNQIRYKVGQMFGDPETTPGGMQPKFASSLSLRLYGKKIVQEKISKDMPTHMEVSGVVKKWRVPIIGNSFKYDLCLSPHTGVATGMQGDWVPGDIIGTWKTVGTRLQASGSLAKKGKEWDCLGVSAPTLEMIETRYYQDELFRLKCQKKVIQEADKIEVEK